MQKEHELLQRVAEAKQNMEQADQLIREYQPFIKAQASKFLGRLCTQQDDAFSIAMIAFHEAIQGYSRLRGPFLRYAALVIRSRLIDEQRRERRHAGQLSLDEPDREDERSLKDTLADPEDPYEAGAGRQATMQEIQELSRNMAEYGISLTDVAENCPQQQRTQQACKQAVRYAWQNPHLLDQLVRTKKLPLAALAQGAGVSPKTLERHRRYVTALLLIYTNGYEIIRGHIRQIVDQTGGEAQA